MAASPRGVDRDSATVGATVAGRGSAGPVPCAQHHTAWCPEPPGPPHAPYVRAASLVPPRDPPHPSLPTPQSQPELDSHCCSVFLDFYHFYHARGLSGTLQSL